MLSGALMRIGEWRSAEARIGVSITIGGGGLPGQRFREVSPSVTPLPARTHTTS